MEPMTKKRLSKFLSLKVQTENHLERIARMKSNEQFPAMRESDGSSRQPGASDRMANSVIRRLTYEEKIQAQIEANLVEIEAIQMAIDALDDPMEQECLRCRYIDGAEDEEGRLKHMPWREVALKVYYSDTENAIRAVTRLHGRALESIRKVDIEQ